MVLEELHLGFRRWYGCLKRASILLPKRGLTLLTEPEYFNVIGLGGAWQQDCLSSGPNPFLVACVFGFLDVAENHRTEDQAMLNARKSLSGCGLYLACQYGHEAIALNLLQKGVSVNTRDQIDNTPLNFAVLTGNEALVRMLLEAGVDVDGEAYGSHSLSLAVYKGSLSLIRILLDFKVNLNMLDMWRGSCLKLAIEQGHEDVAQLLRKAGATRYESATFPPSPAGFTTIIHPTRFFFKLSKNLT